MSSIIVFGGGGQLGRELAEVRNASDSIICLDKRAADIEDYNSIVSAINKYSPRLVINCAAYTAVDKAETELDRATAVNDTAVGNLAKACRNNALYLFHISTDYVFGGDADRNNPYLEQDKPEPINNYGITKLAGEKLLQDIYPEASLIIRTSSVHGAFGNNFVHTMLRLIAEREEVKVVADQTMSPTWTGWLAEVLISLANLKTIPTGIIHSCSAGSISWYDFAAAIREQADFSDLTKEPAKVTPITSKEYPLPAKRPTYSVLDCTRLEQLLPDIRKPWIEGLRGHLKAINRLNVN